MYLTRIAFLISSLATAQDWARINPVTRLTAQTFANPPAVDWPWVRMNLTPGADPAEIAREVGEMHAAGIGGIEVGQGAFPNNEQLVALYTAANRFGLKVSLSRGPTHSPPGYSIDAEHARKTLYAGKSIIEGGSVFDGAAPAGAFTQGSRSGFGLGPGFGGGRPGGGPPGGGGGPRGPQAQRNTLIAVLAYRCSACPASGVSMLDRSSVVDLTASAMGGKLRWQAPSGGQWMITAFWARGVFAQPDPFSDEGTRELIESMETNLSAEVKALMKANGGDLFIDSHSSDRGSPDELWTNRMREEFRARRGYSLVPNLPALFREQFDFNDASAPRVRNDFYAVRGDLWLEKHIAPLRQWIRGYGNYLRVQVEGEANLTIPITDMILATSKVDRPEHENLFVGDEIDNYLPMASANHMTGNTWYSTECCAALGRNYAQSLQDTVIRMHKSFIGGITKLVYHVYPYRDSPQSKWPGYHNFGQAGFSNAWGPRSPNWTDAKAYNDYIARIQQALTQGAAKVDVAVYMHNFLYPPSQSLKTRHWRDLKLQEAGYTRDFLNPTMLALPNATVANGRLAPRGPSYKALIIDSQQEPPTDPVKTSMPVETAKRILGFAKAGLPVIFVGALADRTPGNTPAEDAALKAIIEQILAVRTASRVANQSDVPAKLRALGIRPAAEPKAPSNLLSIRRADGARKTNYYFFYNQAIISPPDQPGTLFDPITAGAPVDQEVSLEGRGRPYVMDAWSGRITPVAQFRVEGDRVVVRLRLSPDNGALYLVTEDPAGFGLERTAARGVARFADSRDLTKAKWHVAIEDWQPANPYQTTMGPRAAETKKLPLELDLNELKAWPAIPVLKDVSGIGVYTTTVELPEWNAEKQGALLSLGEVFDTFTVTVNGRQVAFDQLSAEGDIGAYLERGANTLSVRVATTLNNRLAALDEAVAGRGIVQPYGLVGPVILKPFGR